MLMRDINLLLPSAIRTMRSSLRDVSRQQIPFTVDGLIRQGLPEKFASQVREAAKELAVSAWWWPALLKSSSR